ncbi:alcohol dehydrogenase catalytic domain-containing protein [Geobacter argillaceus]|uniref:(R,R)-butanediol dehydrogenase/meso-butanediol dehydrogenase/diacetyl reductase n=1 Tax=Geobacter argillaceus TaxID=345631 RepID=A0A562VI71_9BACT|nr:alcohol dehydrogenase catalytic domain-containing protein [Geobacter argillaceus]TWJ17484.1 (R,R)-butanediol dehydrogenase/meso-butanediol dehydrogenase/diacetyl reductase [Geobacter argillaceus]
MMKAVVFKEAGKKLEVREVPRPKAGPGELVFKVGACGICASDIHATEVPGMLPPGQVLGHECAGEVVEVGPEVAGDWKVGDRLLSLPMKVCGTCPACQGGDFTQCSAMIIQGFDLRFPGGYAEYAPAFAAMAMKIPPELDVRDAAVIEPLAVGLNAYRTAQVPPGSDVVVVGAGVIGLALANWARFFGAGSVAVSEVVPARIERARKLGVDLVIDAGSCENPAAEFERSTGRPCTVIFECIGRPIIQKLIDMAPSNTHLVVVGAGMQPEQLTPFPAAMKKIRITFALGYDPADTAFVMRMLVAGRISASSLVSATTGLEEVPEMFAALQKPNDHCKVLIVT